MAGRKTITKKVLLNIERGIKRKAQKEAGAMDGRFREKVVPNKKRKAARQRRLDPDRE